MRNLGRELLFRSFFVNGGSCLGFLLGDLREGETAHLSTNHAVLWMEQGRRCLEREKYAVIVIWYRRMMKQVEPMNQRK